MAYSDLSLLKKRVPEQDLRDLTDDDLKGAIDQLKVDDAILGAEAEIDAALRSRYRVPLDPVPDLVAQIATDLAIYRIYGRRPGLEIPATVQAWYDQAQALLDKLARGTRQLEATTEEAPEEIREVVGLGNCRTRAFSRTDLEGMP